MKLILSRKGFDSSSGGVPNPILPDGRMIALPIPDADSVIEYGSIRSPCLQAYGSSLGALVTDLTRGKIKAADGAHLDPDIEAAHLKRSSRWRPAFGQRGSALGHLKKRGVGVGDLFVFFGLFQPVQYQDGVWRYDKQSRPKHIIWGWMQVGEVMLAGEAPKWLSYHPHCQPSAPDTDLLYLARESLSLDQRFVGAGSFERASEKLCLTAKESSKPSLWCLPKWFYPKKREPLSFHAKRERWSLKGGSCLLQSVARGQEFVLDTGAYPEAIEWLISLMESDSATAGQR